MIRNMNGMKIEELDWILKEIGWKIQRVSNLSSRIINDKGQSTHFVLKSDEDECVKEIYLDNHSVFGSDNKNERVGNLCFYLDACWIKVDRISCRFVSIKIMPKMGGIVLSFEGKHN